MDRVKIKRDLIIFIAVSVLIGWVGVLIDQLINDQPDGETLGMGIWLISPLICALILRVRRKDWKSFGINPNILRNVKWYVLSILIFPFILIIFTSIAYLFGLVELGKFEVSVTSLITSALVGLFIKNIFEEFAWRGYLTPKLIDLKVNDFMIYVTTGLVWALWHAAYYLVFLSDDFYSSPAARFQDLGLSLIIIPIWGIMFVEMYRITRSVWPVVIMHVVEDAVPTMLIQVEDVIQFNGVGELLLNPLLGIFPLITYLLFGLWLRKQRIKMNR